MAMRRSHPLLSTSAQLFVLRTVIISSVISVVLCALFAIPGSHSDSGVRSWHKWFWLSTLLVTLVHHIGSVFGPQRFPMQRWMDIPLTFLEAACNWYHSILALKYVREIRSYSAGWDAQDTAALLFQWTVALGLTLWLVLKVAELLVNPARRWSDKLDVSRLSQDPWWAYPTSTMFGRKLWGPTLPGESRWICVLRGVSSLLAFATLFVFGIYQVLVAPYVEISATPHREFQIPHASNAVTESLDQGDWSLVVVWGNENPSNTLSKAVGVQWAFEPGYQDNGTPCRPTSTNEMCGGAENLPLSLCLRSRPDYALCGEPTPRPYLEAIHIQINFTEMFPPDDGLRNDPAAEINAAHIYVGLAEKNRYDGAVRPIRVFAGTHLLSIVDHVIRRRLKSRALATLGYEVYEENVIFEPIYTIPNPLANVSDPNVATLTVTMERFRKGGWVVSEDFRNKSVLTGLSELGGLGSFLSTLLVVFLGTSLMGAMLRTKDSSPLGLLHSGMTEKLIRACREEYPELEADIARFREKPGLVVYLLDSLVALGPLEHLEGDGYSGAEHERVPSHEDDLESIDIPLKLKG